MVTLNNPDAPATSRQLKKIKELGGAEYEPSEITMRQASDKIEELELLEISQSLAPFEIEDGASPFTEAHVTIIEGAQRSGKTCTAVGKVTEAYFMDCVKVFCKDVLHIECAVKSYDRKTRIAKIKYNGGVVKIHIPDNYKLHTQRRIFANIHLFGLPYVFVPSFRHLIYWLKKGRIHNCWLIVDEAHLGANARAGMTSLGQELEKQAFQLGKMQIDVYIITHMARLIDWAIRTIPTERLSCTYNPKTKEITYTKKKKGEQGTQEITYYAPLYWPNYWTNEKINE